jgi:hypothetical protein
MGDQNNTNMENSEEIMRKAREFEHKFYHPDDNTRLKDGLTPAIVLSELGFKQVQFSELDPGLQEALKKPETEHWYGYPLNNDRKEDSMGLTIMKKDDDSVLYFFKANKNDTGRITYACSRLSKLDNIYCVEQIHHRFNIGEIIQTVSSQEIISNKTITGRHCGMRYIEIPVK